EAQFPVIEPYTTPASRALAVVSAIGYYFGFVPPGWLRRTWQMSELRNYLRALAGRPTEDLLVAALAHLASAAVSPFSAKPAVRAVRGDDTQLPRLPPDQRSRAPLAAASLTTVSVGSGSPVLTQAWEQRRPIATSHPRRWGE